MSLSTEHQRTLPHAIGPSPARTPWHVVELVGLAGAGKTTVLRAMRLADTGIRAGLSIDPLYAAPLLMRHSLALLPIITGLAWRQSPGWWKAAIHLVRLRAYPSVLAELSGSSPRAVVLDEGPVYSLSRLCVFQNANRAGGRLTTEWQAALRRMIDLLDVVVWLDAPESVLLRRIGGRTKEIIRGGGTEAELKQLLKAYRVAYREVIEAIRATGRTTIIEVDTATTSPGQTAATILAALAPPSSPSRSSSARC